jgi:3-methyladenine DNA glycosylase AlkD
MPLPKSEIKKIADETTQRVRSLPLRNTPSIRRVRMELTKKLRKENGRDVAAIGVALWKRGLRWVGYEVINTHREALATLTLRDVEALGKGMGSWDAVDTFGCLLAGPALLCGRIAISDVAKWARSEDVWWRRAALVTTVPLNLKSSGGDEKRTLRIASLLIDDREDMVVKAMSWALRALATRQPQAARRFVRERQHRLAARVVREVTNKLTHGLKSGKPRKKS